MRSFRSRVFVASMAVSVAAVAGIATAAPAFADPSDSSQTFSPNGAVQTWTVPDGVTQIYVDLAGGQGGASYGGGGGGAELTGALSVTPGETLNVIAGSYGGNGEEYFSGAGGGGGSFIYTTADQSGILAAAGGGGGAASNNGASSASTSTSGTQGGNGGGGGGTNGSGGGGSTAGGGGGFLSSGGGAGGQSVAGGGLGGGGAAPDPAGGGGGGYSGGGGGNFNGNNGGGGGGGSYFAGSLTGAVNNHGGDGFVTIYYPSVLTSITPSVGPVGHPVTIDGTGLAGATVTIGGVAATVTSSSDTELVVTVPDQSPLPNGPLNVDVATAGGVTLPAVGAFTYAPAPTVNAVSPALIEPGSAPTVTITGAYFTGVTAVYFGDTAATSFTVNSDTTITAVVPSSLSSGTVDTTVLSADGTSATTPADELTVGYPTMTLSPSTLPDAQVGVLYSSQITADGGTSPYTYAITNGAPPTGIVLNPASGVLLGTPTSEGSLPFTVQATDQYGDTSSASYAIDVLPPAPTISAVSPNGGPTSGGTDITITGANFTGATDVMIGSTPAASFTIVSPTTITAVTSATSAGEFDVTVTTPGGTSVTSAVDHFTYAVVPTVTAVGPASGTVNGGTSVTITGTGFTGASAVDFGGVAATYTVNSDTSITAVTPASSAGTVDVTVTTAGGVSATSAADQFVFDPATPSLLAFTGMDAQTSLSIAVGLLLAGLIAGAFTLMARRRREVR
jgi:IPT/TIG domain/Putative Ig domain